MQRGGLHLSLTDRGTRPIAAGMLVAALAVSFTTTVRADAASREMSFLRGLRERGYYDYVAFEIDRVKKLRGILARIDRQPRFREGHYSNRLCALSLEHRIAGQGIGASRQKS